MADTKHDSGLTLIEVLVVVGIIAVLASMVIVLTRRIENQSKQNTLANAFALLKAALQEYYGDQGAFPPQPVRAGDAAMARANMQMMYASLEAVPASREILKGISSTLVRDEAASMDAMTVHDPWGTVLDYVYTPKVDQFPVLISAGPDRQFGTTDDISSRRD